MHIPESLQDLADSEAVRFLKRPKTVGRIFAGVRPCCGPAAPWGTGERGPGLSDTRCTGSGGQEGARRAKGSKRELIMEVTLYRAPGAGPCLSQAIPSI